MFLEADHTGLSQQKVFAKMLSWNPAAIVKCNIDNHDSAFSLPSGIDVPLPELDALNPDSQGISIGIDYGTAVGQLVELMAQTERKNIGLLCSPANNVMFRQVMSGWNRSMLTLNRSPHRVVTTHLPAQISAGINLFRDTMLTWGELDALICTSDEIACGCIMACHSAGIHIPETLAIASLGGGALATVCSPALTTVEFPWHEIGLNAGALLHKRLQGISTQSMIELPSFLKLRASTANPAK